MIPGGMVSFNNGSLYIPRGFDVEDWGWADGEIIKDEDGTWELKIWAGNGTGRAKVKSNGVGHVISLARWFRGNRPARGYYSAEMIDEFLCVDLEEVFAHK